MSTAYLKGWDPVAKQYVDVQVTAGGALVTTATLSGSVNVNSEGAVTTAAPTYLTGTDQKLSLKTTGDLRTNDSALGVQADATWDGAAVASGISIWRYIGTKIEAARALLAGFLSVVGVSAAVGATVVLRANATTYASGQIIAQATAAGSCTPMTIAAARVNDGTGMVRRLRLKINDTPWLNATVRVHLYKDIPTFGAGDGSAWSGNTTESNYIGYSDIVLDKQFSDPYVKGLGVPAVGSEWNFVASAGTPNIFAILEARSAVTTSNASKTFSLVAEVLQN